MVCSHVPRSLPIELLQVHRGRERKPRLEERSWQVNAEVKGHKVSSWRQTQEALVVDDLEVRPEGWNKEMDKRKKATGQLRIKTSYTMGVVAQAEVDISNFEVSSVYIMSSRLVRAP